MREKHTDSVQNRFTAYLMAAVDNTRKKYWERKRRLQGREFIQEDNLERNYTDFEEQYRAYIGEHTDFIFRDWQRCAIIPCDEFSCPIKFTNRDTINWTFRGENRTIGLEHKEVHYGRINLYESRRLLYPRSDT